MANMANINREIAQLKEQLHELNEIKEGLENNENEEEFNEYLDETNPEIMIGSLTYLPSQVLKDVDEIAYNCAFSDYNSSRISDVKDEISRKIEEIKELEE